MVKKLSCVSCGSLKRFPHTFTSLTEIVKLIFLDFRVKIKMFKFIFERIEETKISFRD